MDKRQETLKSISLKVLNMFEVVRSREQFSKCKGMTILRDLILNVVAKNISITTGGVAECTCVSGSDSDIMHVIYEICAVKGTESIPHLTGHISYFQTELESTRPGFCMLRLLKLDNLTCLYERKHAIVKFRDCLVTYGNHYYLSSERFVNMMIHIHEVDSPETERGSTIYRHGPCATVNFKQPIFTDGTRDLAFAIKCHSWPDASVEWLSRPRRHGWPSNELIDSIRKLPCHLMCIGDKESPNFNLEWRFAFVYQELELVWSFSYVQILCYCLLKTLKISFVSPLFSDEIKSYHLKTTMFWLIEEKGSDLWTEENLVQCVLICLDRLKEFIRAGNLPHFFLREHNLFYNKLKKQTKRQNLLSVLTHIQDNIVKSIIEALPLLISQANTENMFDNTLECGNIVLNTMQVLFQNQANRKMDDLYTVFSVEKLFTKMAMIVTPLEACLHLYKKVETLDLDKRILHCVKSFLRIRIAMQSDTLSSLQDEYMEGKMLDDANYNLNASCALDGMSIYLYYATFALLREDFRSAKSRVLSLFNTDRRMLWVDCHNYTWQTIIVQDGKLIHSNKNTLNIDINHNECVAFNVYFVFTDLFCVPEALQYECALLGERNRNFNYFSIHPVIYAYFLLIAVSLREKNVNKVNHYLDLLDGAVRDRGTGLFRHVSFNLLGFSYFKAGKPEKAYNVFCQSLQDYNSCKNAAFYHLCILILDILFRRSGN